MFKLPQKSCQVDRRTEERENIGCYVLNQDKNRVCITEISIGSHTWSQREAEEEFSYPNIRNIIWSDT